MTTTLASVRLNTLRPRHAPQRLTYVLLAAAIVVAASASGAAAQGVHQYSFPEASGGGGNATSTGGQVYSGTAVPTGKGPLSEPVPPAASVYGSRSLGRAATPTYPSSHPFGTQ